MNDLSILLYLADVCEGISGALAALMIFSAIIFAVAGLVYLMERDPVAGPKCGSAVKKSLIWVLVFAAISAPIPSKTTVYLIAASEMGEDVINTDAAQKVMDYLESELDEIARGDE